MASKPFAFKMVVETIDILRHTLNREDTVNGKLEVVSGHDIGVDSFDSMGLCARTNGTVVRLAFWDLMWKCSLTMSQVEVYVDWLLTASINTSVQTSSC